MRAVVPGDPDASELVFRVFTDDEDEVMPPPKSKIALTEHEKNLLREWVGSGGEYASHWAFVAPEKAGVPEGGRAIDYLVGAHLSARGLDLAPQADPAALVRRVTLDSDRIATKAGGGGKVCRRPLGRGLRGLGRPASGVARLRRAHGLGLARRGSLCRQQRIPERCRAHDVAVAGLGGFRLQRKPALRRVHGLAGGRGSPAGPDLRAASRHRISPQPPDQRRGGADRGGEPGRLRHGHDRNRGNRLAGVDHELLPLPRPQVRSREPAGVLPTRRLLQPDPGEWRRRKPAKPRRSWTFPRRGSEAKLADLDARIAAVEAKIEAIPPAPWEPLAATGLASAAGQEIKGLDDRSILTSGKNPDTDTYTVTTRPESRKVAAVRLEALRHPSMTGGGIARSNSGNFVLTDFGIAVKSTDHPDGRPLKIKSATASFEQGNLKITNAFDDNPGSGWAVHEGRMVDRDHEAVFTLQEPATLEPGSELVFTLAHNSHHKHHNLGRFRISVIEDATKVGRSIPQELEKEKADLKKQRENLRKNFPKVMVMADQAGLRKTHVLAVGSYQKPLEEVPNGNPRDAARPRRGGTGEPAGSGPLARGRRKPAHRPASP